MMCQPPQSSGCRIRKPCGGFSIGSWRTRADPRASEAQRFLDFVAAFFEAGALRPAGLDAAFFAAGAGFLAAAFAAGAAFFAAGADFGVEAGGAAIRAGADGATALVATGVGVLTGGAGARAGTASTGGAAIGGAAALGGAGRGGGGVRPTCAASASRISLSASSWVICPRRTMY